MRHGARRVTALLFLTLVFAGGGPARAQVDAVLPYRDAVPESDARPIDGVWTVSTLGKRIRISKGRAWAVDSWLHLFVLHVKPDMVVMRDVQRLGVGVDELAVGVDGVRLDEL